jgi:hypothetical protein
MVVASSQNGCLLLLLCCCACPVLRPVCAIMACKLTWSFSPPPLLFLHTDL